MAEYKLQCFAQSGNAYKVALMLELSQASWTLSGSIFSCAPRS